MPFYENFSKNRPTTAGAGMALLESGNHLKAILKIKPTATAFLEIGPGRGSFAEHCLRRGFDYTCAEISWSLLNALPYVQKKVRTLVPSLPFSKDSFDITFASNLLEHMAGFRDALHFIEEMQRVTRPGGLVCHRVPNAMAWGLHFWNGDYTHSFFTTPRTVSQVYLDAGLKIEGIYPVSGPVMGGFAYFVSLLGKLIPSFIVDHGANPSSRLSKAVYSAKTTFLRGFLIVGRRVH